LHNEIVKAALENLPIYEALLERDIRRDETTPELHGTLVLELPLQADAPSEGKRVLELGIPPGCILVTLKRGIHAYVPTAETRLEEDRITVVIAPQAAAAVSLLRHACAAPHTAKQTRGESTVIRRHPDG
jgi:chloride channel protein, CIC family